MSLRAFAASFVAALAVGIAAPVVQANVISIKMTNSSTGMAATDLAGAPGVRVSNYNNLAVTSTTATSSLTTVKDNTGATLPLVTVTLTPASGQNNSVAGSVSGTNDAALFSSSFDQFSTPASSVTVTNIPYSTYDVYFYREGDEANANLRAGQFTIGSQNRYVRGGLADPNNTGSGYVLSNDTTNTGGSITQGNYVVFTGLTGSTLTASFNGVAAGDTINRNKVAGFQIVQTPEPTSATLLGLAGLGFLGRRTRTRVQPKA